MGWDNKGNFKDEMSLDLHHEEKAEFSWVWEKGIKNEPILRSGHTQEYIKG